MAFGNPVRLRNCTVWQKQIPKILGMPGLTAYHNWLTFAQITTTFNPSDAPIQFTDPHSQLSYGESGKGNCNYLACGAISLSWKMA